MCMRSSPLTGGSVAMVAGGEVGVVGGGMWVALRVPLRCFMCLRYAETTTDPQGGKSFDPKNHKQSCGYGIYVCDSIMVLMPWWWCRRRRGHFCYTYIPLDMIHSRK